MSNIIKRGIDWLNTKVDSHCVEPVYVTTAAGSQTVQATVIEPESRVNSEGVRVQSDTFMILFDTSLKLNLRPGDRIRRVNYDQLYEVVRARSGFDDYNDPNLTKIAVPAKLCS